MNCLTHPLTSFNELLDTASVIYQVVAVQYGIIQEGLILKMKLSLVTNKCPLIPIRRGTTFEYPIFIKFRYVVNTYKNFVFCQKKTILQISYYKETDSFFLYLILFLFFIQNYCLFYIILMLRPLQTQNFLNYRNILSGLRDIRKRKKSKNSYVKIFEKIQNFKKC